MSVDEAFEHFLSIIFYPPFSEYMHFSAILLLLFLSIHTKILAQDTTLLPAPTGRFAVGMLVREWEHTDEPDTFTPQAQDWRTISVQIRYPADTSGMNIALHCAPYAPLFPETRHIITYTRLNMPFAKEVAQAPVVVICPGRGVSKHEYTIIAEDLASHGYIVVNLDMPYIGFVAYLDGRIIKPAPQFKVPPELLAGNYAKVDEFFRAATELGVSDVRRTIQGLRDLQNDKQAPLYQHIDLQSMGIFGHSLGGRIAGAALAVHSELKAYISMEGIAPAEIRQNGVTKPMAYLMSEGLVKFAMQNYKEALPKRKGSVFITVLKDFGHNSFTDMPLTQAQSAKYAIPSTQGFIIARSLLRRYFDYTLRNQTAYKEWWCGEQIPESLVNTEAFE